MGIRSTRGFMGREVAFSFHLSRKGRVSLGVLTVLKLFLDGFIPEFLTQLSIPNFVI